MQHKDLSTNTATDTLTNLKDTVAPTLNITTPLDFIISANQTSYSFSGTCSEDGELSGVAGAQALARSCSSNTYTLDTLDLSAESDGIVALSIVITDAAGNDSIITTENTTKDTSAPNISLDSLGDINSSNQANYSVSGTCSENGEDVDLTIGSVSSLAPCTGGVFSFTSLDVSAVPDSSALTVSVSHQDAATIVPQTARRS